MSIKNFAFMLGATAVFGLVQSADCMDQQSPKQPEPNKNQRLVSFIGRTPSRSISSKGSPMQRTCSVRPGDADCNKEESDSGDLDLTKSVRPIQRTCSRPAPKADAEQVAVQKEQSTATSVSSNKSFSEILEEEQAKSDQEKANNPDSNGPVKLYGDDFYEEEEEEEEWDDGFLTQSMCIYKK